MVSFNDKVLKCIPAEVFMISSSQDNQISNEAHNTSGFELPDPAGKTGGACTSAVLDVLYSRGHEVGKNLSWVHVLKDMYASMTKQGFADQLPQLSSSRWIDINQPMFIAPPKSGVRRALLIGINYVGQGKGELKSCHNDVENMKSYLIKAQGFRLNEILVLKDDGNHTSPTKENIMNGLIRLTQYSQPGDVVFVSFSGHGGRVADENGDEEDGFDESIIPVDFKENGQIVDDDLLDIFVKRLKGGVTCTVIMDCCHSGTVLDLPYFCAADDKSIAKGMQMEKQFAFDTKDKKKKVVGADGGGIARGGKSKKELEAERQKAMQKLKAPKRTVNEKPIPKLAPRKPAKDKKAAPPPPPPPQRCTIQ